MKLTNFLVSESQQYECNNSFSKDQRAIVHKLADELNLKHLSKGNWRKMILNSYKSSLIDSGLTGRQVISKALQKKACLIQSSN